MPRGSPLPSHALVHLHPGAFLQGEDGHVVLVQELGESLVAGLPQMGAGRLPRRVAQWPSQVRSAYGTKATCRTPASAPDSSSRACSRWAPPSGL